MSRRISLRKSKSSKNKTSTKAKATASSSKLPTRKLKINFKSIRLWTVTLLVVSLGVLGAGLYMWYENIYSDEERIFYGMIEKSLATDSISRTIIQNEATRTEQQDYFLTFSPDPVVKSRSEVEQVDQNREKSIVETETIGTRDTDYIRYTNIVVPPNSQDTTDYNKVLGDWAYRSSDEEKGQSAQFLNEAIFTFIPFGNFNQADRGELVKLIRDKEVYQLSKDGKIIYENGRPVYNVTVSIKPRSLVEVLKKYAEYTDIGDMSMLNPEQYDDQYSFSIQVKIDMLSRHLREIGYPGDVRKEVYQSYGLNRNIELPNDAITVEQLQQDLQ